METGTKIARNQGSKVPDAIDTMNVVPDGSFEIGAVREREGGHIAESLV